MSDVEDQVDSHSEEEKEDEDFVPETNGKKKAPAADENGATSDEGVDDDDYQPSKAKKKAAAKKPAPKKRKSKDDDDSADEDWGKRKKKKAAGGAKKGTGFTKAFNLSEELAAVVGSDVMPRHEVVKQMWAYIKGNELQDPKNKQFIICDEPLQKVIGVKRFKAFGMMKYLKEHFLEAA